MIKQPHILTLTESRNSLKTMAAVVEPTKPPGGGGSPSELPGSGQMPLPTIGRGLPRTETPEKPFGGVWVMCHGHAKLQFPSWDLMGSWNSSIPFERGP